MREEIKKVAKGFIIWLLYSFEFFLLLAGIDALFDPNWINFSFNESVNPFSAGIAWFILFVFWTAVTIFITCILVEEG